MRTLRASRVLARRRRSSAALALAGRRAFAARRQRQDALQHQAVNDALEVLRAEILEIKPHAERQPGDSA